MDPLAGAARGIARRLLLELGARVAIGILALLGRELAGLDAFVAPDIGLAGRLRGEVGGRQRDPRDGEDGHAGESEGEKRDHAPSLIMRLWRHSSGLIVMASSRVPP